MVADAQVKVLLTQSSLLAALPESRAQVVCVDLDWESIAQERTAAPVTGVTAEHLAYMIYTSGSTGQPKGVLNTHRGICNRLWWMQQVYQLTEADRILQKTPYSFDVSVWELFWPLLTGTQVILARPRGHQDPGYLVGLIIEQQITVVHFVPPMLRIFLEEPNVEQCRSLRQVICSGEALAYDLQRRFFSLLSSSLDNLYGPTEAAVDVTYWRCRREDERSLVPIGRPVANTQVYILDPYLRPVPIGVAGELHIGGVQVGRGYFRQPELTAAKFIADPFSADPQARLYKTGDLARYLPDGNIEFLGRLDYQVKLRGFRIEPDEISAVLMQHPAIQDTVVVLREDQPGDKRLVAYLVPAQSQLPTLSELHGFVQSKLPDYMVPSAFVFLDKLPLTPNGKVERRALPPPELTRPALAEPYRAASTPTEAFLVEIWAAVLKVERVGVHDNFFELGGHSLLAMRVVARINTRAHHAVSLRSMFEFPTIAALAKLVDEQRKQQADNDAFDSLLSAIEALSEEDAEGLLAADA
jgi:amino acid adenylation domain-containing protein